MEVSKINSVKMATPQKVAFGKRETDVQERTQIKPKDAFIGAAVLGATIFVTVGILKKPNADKALKKLEAELNKRGFKIAHSLDDTKSIKGVKIAKEMEQQIEDVAARTSKEAHAKRAQELKAVFAPVKKAKAKTKAS